MTDGATYIEVLMLQHLSAPERAQTIGHAMITPLLASDGADDGADSGEQLRFWCSLLAYLMGVAESRVGPEGRAVIVQAMMF